MTRFVGVDLAWGAGRDGVLAKETGLVLLDSAGTVVDAGWAQGVTAVTAWIESHLADGDVVAIDAPLVVTNADGQRSAEREVGQRYMSRWQVAANSTNLAKAHLEGVVLRERLEALGVRYTTGLSPYDGSSVVFECYPYTTIVGAAELGYDVGKPLYKRKPSALPTSRWAEVRARECDDLIARVGRLATASPPLDLMSHPVTAELLTSPSPLRPAAAYKHREDLLDAALCAWTAALWATRHLEAVQILGLTETPDADGRVPTIVAPARPEQRR